MPVLKHAKKKLRQDKKRTLKNRKVRELFRGLVKKATASPTVESIALAYKEIDKAAKRHLMHPNKAARLKSSLAKIGPGGKSEGIKKVAPKKAVKKKAPSKKVSAKKK